MRDQAQLRTGGPTRTPDSRTLPVAIRIGKVSTEDRELPANEQEPCPTHRLVVGSSQFEKAPHEGSSFANVPALPQDFDHACTDQQRAFDLAGTDKPVQCNMQIVMLTGQRLVPGPPGPPMIARFGLFGKLDIELGVPSPRVVTIQITP